MEEGTLRVIAVRAFQEAQTRESTPIDFEPTEGGWSKPKPKGVHTVMDGIAGWRNAAPDALSVGAWKTVVRKLRGLGIEVQDPFNPNQGIDAGEDKNKPKIRGKVRIRWWVRPVPSA